VHLLGADNQIQSYRLAALPEESASIQESQLKTLREQVSARNLVREIELVGALREQVLQ
jgi:hypothetical protein